MAPDDRVSVITVRPAGIGSYRVTAAPGSAPPSMSFIITIVRVSVPPGSTREGSTCWNTSSVGPVGVGGVTGNGVQVAVMVRLGVGVAVAVPPNGVGVGVAVAALVCAGVGVPAVP